MPLFSSALNAVSPSDWSTDGGSASAMRSEAAGTPQIMVARISATSSTSAINAAQVCAVMRTRREAR